MGDNPYPKVDTDMQIIKDKLALLIRIEDVDKTSKFIITNG